MFTLHPIPNSGSVTCALYLPLPPAGEVVRPAERIKPRNFGSKIFPQLKISARRGGSEAGRKEGQEFDDGPGLNVKWDELIATPKAFWISETKALRKIFDTILGADIPKGIADEFLEIGKRLSAA
ncbi:hypothetical protein Tcan_07544 [Toxocara canis]|uniref:Uncharacterized protein n=1 Tax=Toxocara canis TaxID=6265 RepID=A0A0B2VKT2_TOXCA|nr:hypothetical protein Tcan_07544 [Toxocara canis]